MARSPWIPDRYGPPGESWCTGCRRWLPDTEFGISANGYIKRSCKKCIREYSRQWREENREAVAAYNASRRVPPSELVCSECEGEFRGRPNKLTCSDACRAKRKARLDTRWPVTAGRV